MAEPVAHEQSPERIDRLRDAMWQILDDMREDGKCVCGATKAQARVAFEPFREDEGSEDFMSLEEAHRILREVGLDFEP